MSAFFDVFVSRKHWETVKSQKRKLFNLRPSHFTQKKPAEICVFQQKLYISDSS